MGQFSAQWVAEWFGRRWAVFTIMGVQTIVSLLNVNSHSHHHLDTSLTAQAAIIEAVAPTPAIWTLGKFIAGIGIGAVQATLPVVSYIFPR